jgi:hypothetical protein
LVFFLFFQVNLELFSKLDQLLLFFTLFLFAFLKKLFVEFGFQLCSLREVLIKEPNRHLLVIDILLTILNLLVKRLHPFPIIIIHGIGAKVELLLFLLLKVLVFIL